MKSNRLLALSLILGMILLLCGCKSSDYKKAVELYNSGNFDAAEKAFLALGDYKDAADYLADIPYQEARALLSAKDYEAAEEAFLALGDYKDAADQAEEAALRICEKWIDEFGLTLRKVCSEYKMVSKKQVPNAVAFSGRVFHDKDSWGDDENVDIDGSISLDRSDCRFDWIIEQPSIGEYYKNTSEKAFVRDKRNMINQNWGSYTYAESRSIFNFWYFTDFISQLCHVSEEQTIEAVFRSFDEVQSLGEWTIKADLSEENDQITFHLAYAA